MTVPDPIEVHRLICARCGAHIVSDSEEAAQGLALIHEQDCQGEGWL